MKNTYQIDQAHSGAHFSIRHMMISNIRGSFSGVTGTVVYDPENPGATSIDAVIDATTFNTLDGQRDAHVRARISWVRKNIRPSPLRAQGWSQSTAAT